MRQRADAQNATRVRERADGAAYAVRSTFRKKNAVAMIRHATSVDVTHAMPMHGGAADMKAARKHNVTQAIPRAAIDTRAQRGLPRHASRVKGECYVARGAGGEEAATCHAAQRPQRATVLRHGNMVSGIERRSPPSRHRSEVARGSMPAARGCSGDAMNSTGCCAR